MSSSEYKPLQRALADSIIRKVPIDEIRILLASGAKVLPLHFLVKLHPTVLSGGRAGESWFKTFALRSLARVLRGSPFAHHTRRRPERHRQVWLQPSAPRRRTRVLQPLLEYPLPLTLLLDIQKSPVFYSNPEPKSTTASTPVKNSHVVPSATNLCVSPS